MIKPILIPTEKSNIVKILDGVISYTTTLNIPGGEYFDIILIDTEQEIVGWYYDTFTNKIYNTKGAEYENSTQVNKIISSTNKFHILPQLSSQSIQLLINYYNGHGEMPESVKIEMEEIDSQEYYAELNYYGRTDLKLEYEIKLNQQGEVDITIPEVEEIIGKPMDDYVRDKHTQEECVGFIDGWNAAKEKLYTEEEVKFIYKEYQKYLMNKNSNSPLMDLIKWFNTNKK